MGQAHLVRLNAYACIRMTDTLRKDCVILQLYWWLFSSTKHYS